MFKICKAEFKKLFMKPSIFVVTGILIFTLAICSFIYHPNNRNSTYITTKSTITTVADFYNELNSSSLTNTFTGFNQTLVGAKNFIDSYATERDVKAELNGKIDNILSAYSKYQQSYTEYISYGYGQEQLDRDKDALKYAFTSFLDFYNSTVPITKSNQEIHVLTTNAVNLKITSFTQKCIDVFDASTSDLYQYIIQKLDREYKFNDTLRSYVDELIPFIPNTDYVNTLYSYITKASERLGIEIVGTTVNYTSNGMYQTIKAQVDEWKQTTESNKSKDNFEKLRYMATCYKQETEQVLNIVTDAIYLNALEKYSQNQLNGFLGLENVNYYETKENFVKLNYLFDTYTFEIDYANPFSIDQPSNFKLNAYDFSYFAMRLCMFIIVIYVITMAATTIVGEQESGTMKMLAIRPYKREKLLGGKLLAIIFIGLIMIAVSAVATLILGGISYGFASNPILYIFNAQTAYSISPFLFYIIMLLTLAYEMIFFVLCALAISLLFKSQIASISISILLFFGTLALNTVLDSASWLKILPFTNINLYKYLGSSFMTTQGALQKILSSPVAVGSNFWLSFIYSLVVMIGLVVLVIEVFKHRDLR